MTSTAAETPPEPPESRPGRIGFHHMGRAAPRYRWWRPVAGTSVIAGGTVLIVTLARAGIPAVATAIDGPRVHVLLAALVLGFAGVALTLPLVLAVTRWIEGRGVGTLISITGRIRWSWLGWCSLAAVVVTIATIAVSSVVASRTAAGASPPLHPHALTWGTVALVVNSLMVIVVLVALQSTAEEFVTRGWLLQAVGGFTRDPWLAIAVQAVAFTVLHGLNGNRWEYLHLFSYAIIIGWLTVATGGIEAAVAYHVAFNGLSMVLAVPVLIVLGADPDSSDQAVTWQLAAVQVFFCLLYAAAVRWWSRRRLVVTRPSAAQARATAAAAL